MTLLLTILAVPILCGSIIGTYYKLRTYYRHHISLI